MNLQLGCIADDFTGASDVALMLAERGMPVTQVLGLPDENLKAGTAAVVIALKTRTTKAAEAVRQSRKAAEWLLEQGAQQVMFKYCSTFDSTADGNIGPVTDALLSVLDDDFTVVCPAFPANGRTVHNGMLMVNGQPLSESSMRHHPLTPMRNSNLLELMDEQTHEGASIGIDLKTVRGGKESLRAALARAKHEGYRYAIPDAETDADLLALGEACARLKLVTGASGIAIGLPNNFLPIGKERKSACVPLPQLPGHAVIIAGSCSQTTRSQVEFMRAHCGFMDVHPCKLASGEQSMELLCNEAVMLWQKGPVMVTSEADPQKVKEAQAKLGREQAAALVEQTLAEIAEHLASRGACKFILAGGETSGAVAAALGSGVLLTGPRIDPGVPWMVRADQPTQVLAFKSGNFGSRDFFLRALEMLP